MSNIAKSLIALAIIAICAVVLFFGYQRYYVAPNQQKAQIDLTKSTIITHLASIGNLETIRMNMQKTVEGKKWLEDILPNRDWDNVMQSFLFGDKIELIAYAEIVAWFDISNITTGDIKINPDNSITLTLPAPKILSAYLTKDTKPFLRETGILTKSNAELETQIRNETLKIMTNEAIQKNIFEVAIKNAGSALSPLINSMWFTLKEILIKPEETLF